MCLSKGSNCVWSVTMAVDIFVIIQVAVRLRSGQELDDDESGNVRQYLEQAWLVL